MMLSMGNGQQPATKQDLLELESRVDQKLTSLENRVVEVIRDTETKLLRAFYRFAEGTQQHFADVDGSVASLRQRLGSLETRVTEIEKRLNTPRPGA